MPIELANAHPINGADSEWVLYGATGVTGRIVLERALAAGLRPRLSGRASAGLSQLAKAHGLTAAPAALDDQAALRRALAGARLVLNAAGPFGVTAGPLTQAAFACGCDYLDLNGELAALIDLLGLDGRAKAAGVALIGGCGFGVAASDGLALAVSERLGGADRIRIAVAADSAFSSPAVTESTLGVIAGGGREVARSALVRRRLARRRWTERFSGQVRSFASAPLADLAAAGHATPATEIVAGVPMPRAQALATSLIAPLLPLLLKLAPVRRAMASTGGHAAAAAAARPHLSQVVVTGARGRQRAAARLEAGEGYAAAADIAVAAIKATLQSRPPAGAHTPATAFGATFIANVPGVTITHF